MRRKLLSILSIAAALILALLAAGCHSAKETEDIAFVTCMGVDKAEQGRLKVTYEIEIPRAMGSPQVQGAGSGASDGSSMVNTVVAANTAAAHELLTATVSREINLTHLRVFLISEELAREGIEDLIAPLVRYREYRGSMYVCVVKGSAAEYILANKPKVDYLPSKFWESFMLASSQSSYYLPWEVHDVYLRLKNPGGSACAAYIAINPMSDGGKAAGASGPGEKTPGYLAGDLPRGGTANPPEFAGLAVFSGTRMVGTLDTEETRTLAILEGKLSQGIFALEDPLAPERIINIRLRNGARPKIRARLTNGQEDIDIDVLLEGEITAITSNINYEEKYRGLLEQRISEVVTMKIRNLIRRTQELGSDVAGFGFYLRPGFTTYDELEKINLEELYRTAHVSVKVTTRIRRTGMMWRSSPYKPGAAP